MAEPGKLLGAVLAELGLDHEVHSSGAATVRDGSLNFNVAQQVERHFLMRIEVAEFVVPVSVTGEAGVIELGHRGGRKRREMTVRPRPDRPDLRKLADRLKQSVSFAAAFLPLDSKKAVIEIAPESSVARIRHVGFSRVVMAFPPTQKYITAGREQVEALLATMLELAGFP